MDIASEYEIRKYYTMPDEIKQEFHQGISYFKCDLCGSLFSQSQSVKIHIARIHHAILKQDFDCGTCGKSFLDVEYLKLHTWTLHKNHICHHCLKTFIREQHLKNHMNFVHHEGPTTAPIKDSKCHNCGKSFAQVEALKLHIQMVHENEKDKKSHKYILREKSFTSKDHLKKHFQEKHHNNAVHVDGKYQKKMSHQAESYKMPIVGGEDKTDNECELCGKSFTLAGNLTKHKQIIHAGQTQNIHHHKLYAKFIKNHFLRKKN